MVSEAETYTDVFGEEVEWKPEAPVTFWFTRHGVSEYNLEDRIGGDSNITPAGQVFADTLPSLFGRVLQESGDDHRFISVWTSTLIRTIQTASKLPLPQIHLKELDEINAGVCDGATYEYIKKYMPFIHYNRKKDKLGYRYPSGESYIDLCKRVWPIVRQLKAHGGSKLIVGHQAVLRCIFGYLEGRPLKDITHLSVPHHQIFQFTVHTDGTITRKDFHMDLVRDPSNPEAPIPGWPFDVSHSRPLTATDIARYSPKPMRPLLINRVASLSDAPPASSTTADPNSQGVPPPGLPPVLPDPDTCAAFAACSSRSSANTASVAMRGKRLANVSDARTDTDSQQTRTSRLKTSQSGRAALQSLGSKSIACIAGMHFDERRLLSCKSQTAAMPGGAPVLKGRDSEGPARLHSAPADMFSCLESFSESSQPGTREEPNAPATKNSVEQSEPFAVFGHATQGSSSLAKDSSNQETPVGMSTEPHVHYTPCLPEHRGGSPAPCSIAEKCGSLWAHTRPSTLSSECQMGSFPIPMDARANSSAATVVLHSTSSSFSSAAGPPRSLFLQQQPPSGSCSGAGSRTRSGDILSSTAAGGSTAAPSKDNSPLKQVQDCSAQNIPPEVRCMACGAMVPVHPKPCDIKPSRVNSGNVQNVLASYLPEGISSTMTLQCHALSSYPNSKQASFNIGSAFDFDDAVPQSSHPSADSSQGLPQASLSQPPQAGMACIPSTVAAAAPSSSSPSMEPSTVTVAAERDSSAGGIGVHTPQLELREAVVHSTVGMGLSPLDMGSGDPGAEYPGSPCAPYPLITTSQHHRAMSELALAFQELRTRGSYSNTGSATGGAGSSLPEGGGMPRSGRLSMPRGMHVHLASDSFVTDDPCVRAEELRRKLEDSQGFHFRGEACRLVETSLRERQQSRDDPVQDPHMQQPADLAW